MEENTNHVDGSIHDSMFPFVLPFGKPFFHTSGSERKVVRFQLQKVNHNSLDLKTAYEIGNNVSGTPVKHTSGHAADISKGMELLWFKWNMVRKFLSDIGYFLSHLI